MSAVYVDCDGTLVLQPYSPLFTSQYGAPDPEKYWGDINEPNKELVKALDNYNRINPYDLIVVWSGGGVGYAERWAQLYLTDIYHAAIAKDTLAPRHGDIVIDDEEFRPRIGAYRGLLAEGVLVPDGKAVVLTPQQFVECFGAK